MTSTLSNGTNIAPKESTINAYFLHTLLLAEITRLLYGKEKMSLTNPKIEKMARHEYAAKAGIAPNSKPTVFLSSLKLVYADNDLQDKFTDTLKRFKLNATDF